MKRLRENKIILIIFLLVLQLCNSQVKQKVTINYSYEITNHILYITFKNNNYTPRLFNSPQFGIIIIDNKLDYKDFVTKLINYGAYLNTIYNITDHFGYNSIEKYYDFQYEGNGSNYIKIYDFNTPDIIFRITKGNAIVLGNKLLSDIELMN